MISYSGGPRGCSTIAELHMDIEVLLKQASRELPLFLYGHSLGGMLILSLALRNPELHIAGVITTSALIKFPRDRTLPPSKVFLIRLIGKSLEDVVVNSLINPTALTKNNYHIKKQFGDRLMIPFLGMNMARNIIECTEYIIPHANEYFYLFIFIYFNRKLGSISLALLFMELRMLLLVIKILLIFIISVQGKQVNFIYFI